ncbi:MAG: hypothetical protein WBB39_04245 [Candidatus Saccharimonadales bacterium]
MNQTHSISQSGFVSIFSVIFFVIFISILTVGFLRIISQEQQQATDNSSTSSALAAARAGVEDGKRIILARRTGGASLVSAIDNGISTDGCTSLFANATIASSLNINTDGRVSGLAAGSAEQKYTCLKISLQTDSYEASATQGKSSFIPLMGLSAFNTIEFYWYNIAKEGSIGSGTLGVGDNPTVGDLKAKGLPTFMRLQLFAAPTTNITDASIASYTKFFSTYKASSSLPIVTTSMIDDNATDKTNAISSAGCYAGNEYACQVSLTAAVLPSSPTMQYFLRVTPIHDTTNYKVVLRDTSGAIVKFDGVQPTIDSTGKSGSTYRRLLTRVKYTPDVTLPEFTALMTGGGGNGSICKAFTVTSTSFSDSATCPLP